MDLLYNRDSTSNNSSSSSSSNGSSSGGGVGDAPVTADDHKEHAAWLLSQVLERILEYSGLCYR